jgi:hypothetical protein
VQRILEWDWISPEKAYKTALGTDKPDFDPALFDLHAVMRWNGVVDRRCICCGHSNDQAPEVSDPDGTRR